MAVGIQGEGLFENVERLDQSNFTLFRQWERSSASGRRVSLAVIAALVLVLLIVVIGVWVVSERAIWTFAVSAIALMALGWVVLYRRSLRFNSLIVAKEFVVWETQCQQAWMHLQRSYRFRDLDLPFKLKRGPLVVPLDEITNWSVQEDEHADGTAPPTVRIVLWRGSVALRTFFVASRERALLLEKSIRTAIERMNP